MEHKLRTALAIEHKRRIVAEGRAEQIASLSPVEQAMLAAWARTARSLRAPKPRCFCCGGPLFWFGIVPWLFCVAFTGGSPMKLFADTPTLRENTSTLRAPAATLLARGTPTRKRPVLIVPGMTSTALEVWRGTDCYAGAHRRRLWSFRESLTLAVDPACLRKHLALNKTTWDDLDGISVRASTGLSAADAFGPLNLWGELLRNLAMLDYDERSVRLLGYDWRLSPRRLQQRDGWFTQLRRATELLRELNGEKVVVVAHSLGATHVLHFFGWIEAKSPGWTDAHVAAFVSIGGTFLGSAKAYAYPVTGEMTESIGLGNAFAAALEAHGGLGRTSVAELTRTWASVPALLPRGGRAYWPNGTFLTIEKPSPDVLEALRRDAASSKVARALLERVSDGATLDVDGALDLLRAMLPTYGALFDGEYEIRAPALPARKQDHRYIGNPLNAPLPKAKHMQVYCLYGFGKPTPAGLKLAWAAPRPGADVPERYLEISKGGSGVVQGDGDGTVPLASLGYHCASGWGGSRLNPARVRVRLKEYEHEAADPLAALLRPLDALAGLGNDRDADHVGILGNKEVIGDLLDVVAYGGEGFEERIGSDICAVADQIRAATGDVIDDGGAALTACGLETPSPRPETSFVRRVLEGRRRRREL